MQKLLQSLTEADFQVVRATEPRQIADLDEDDLLDLHARVRRARNKHVGKYRRAGAVKVGTKGSRAAAKEANDRNAARAEVFEDALSRVSRQLAQVARRSAAELKAERLARAQQTPVPNSSTPRPQRTVRSSRPVRADDPRDNPGRKKRDAGTKATGARRQAARDRRS